MLTFSVRFLTRLSTRTRTRMPSHAACDMLCGLPIAGRFAHGCLRFDAGPDSGRQATSPSCFNAAAASPSRLRAATSTSFRTFPHRFQSQTTPHAPYGVLLSKPVLPHADWCLRSDVVSDSRLFFRSHFLNQLADALAYLDRAGIAHLDLKPANILLSTLPAPQPPMLRLADFGLSSLADRGGAAGAGSGTQGRLRGSPLYMAPEIVLHRRYDGRCDLWSVGVVLHEVIFGQAPFHSATYSRLGLLGLFNSSSFSPLRAWGEPPPSCTLTLAVRSSPAAIDTLYRMPARVARVPGTPLEAAR